MLFPPNLAGAAQIEVVERTAGSMMPGGSESNTELNKNNAITLVSAYDDIADEFGESTCEEMYRDPAVRGTITALRISALSSGLRCVSARRSFRDPQFEKAKQISMAASEMIKRHRSAIFDLTIATVFGHALAEIMWELAPDPVLKKPAYRPAKLSIRDRRNYYLITDWDMNLIGVAPKASMKGLPGNTPKIEKGSIVPAEKFVFYVPFPLYSDPRGARLIRPAYNPWHIKKSTWGAYFGYLSMFSTPNVVVTAGEGHDKEVPRINYLTGDVETGEGGVTLTEPIELANYRAVMNMVEGGANVLSLPAGVTAQLLFAQGSGEAFIKGFEALDRQIVMGIVGSARSLLEAQRSSKADSETAADLFDLLVAHIRWTLEDCLQKLVELWYRYNIGDDLDLCPRVSLTEDTGRNFSTNAAGVSSLYSSGYFHDSQIEGLDDFLGIPERDMAQYLADKEEEEQKAEEVELERQKMMMQRGSGGAGGGGRQAEED